MLLRQLNTVLYLLKRNLLLSGPVQFKPVFQASCVSVKKIAQLIVSPQ